MELPTCEPNVVLEPEIMEGEVRNAVWKMKNGKAVGPDEVTVDLVKVLG